MATGHASSFCTARRWYSESRNFSEENSESAEQLDLFFKDWTIKYYLVLINSKSNELLSFCSTLNTFKVFSFDASWSGHSVNEASVGLVP